VSDVRQGVRRSSYFEYINNLVYKLKSTMDKIFKRSLRENLQRILDVTENAMKKAVNFFLREGKLVK